MHFNVLYSCSPILNLNRTWSHTFIFMLSCITTPLMVQAQTPLVGLKQTEPQIRIPAQIPAVAPTLPAGKQQHVTPSPTLNFAELEAAGAVIGNIKINSQNIFDLENPKEDNWPYRLANASHFTTHTSVIRYSLLFKTGEPVSVRLIEETERVLRRNQFLYDVSITPVAYKDGRVDVEIKTRDSWSLEFGAIFGRSGGTNTTSVMLVEKNLLGMGIHIGYSGKTDVDRTGTEFTIGKNHLFGNWEQISYAHAIYDDGKEDRFALNRPFYALDARWAAGMSADVNERIESEFNSGVAVGQYHHSSASHEIFGGLSRGLVNGWARRYSAGVQYQQDEYQLDPLLPTPSVLPFDQKIIAPFVRYEVVEDQFEKVTNRNLINRAEFFNLGLTAKVQLGRSMWDSTRKYWIYDGSISEGWHLSAKQSLFLSGHLSGRNGNEGGDVRLLGGLARYYRPQSGYGLFYAEAAVDTVHEGTASDQLLLGGDTGLRGYPLRYQTGTQRVLLSLEQRGYSNLYLFRIFRVGGAVFYDVGRAWGGVNQNVTNPSWLSDVGIGIRVFNDRSAFGNVIHIDLAFPINHTDNIKSVQFLIKGQDSF